jgi:Plavaka transposase
MSIYFLMRVSYSPQIPDKITDFIRSVLGTTPPKELLTFCKRELMHGAWHLLLDDDFKKGWTQGWVIKCADGVTRRIFPRIFTYSADYPEKCVSLCK